MPSSDEQPLAPPKPQFLASERNSWNSQDTGTSSDYSDPTSPSTPVAPSSNIPQFARASGLRANPITPLANPSATSPSAARHRRRASFMIHPDTDTSQPPSESGHQSYANEPPPPLPASRPPPSSFAFPFQAYPGNPDPGTSIPGFAHSRRSSWDSVQRAVNQQFPTHTGSLTDLHNNRPYAPFMAANGSSTPPSASTNSLYRGSAASAVALPPGQATLPRSSSQHSFRAPFLSPASRPGSTVWSPPPLPSPGLPNNISVPASPSASTAYLAFQKPSKPPLPSTRLQAKLENSDKPWLTAKDKRAGIAWWMTLGCLFLGVAASAIVIWRGVTSVLKLDDSQLCLVMNEDFSRGDIDFDNNWVRDVELSGFGNGEFQMTTDSSDNSFIRNGQLYIFPSLTSDSVENVIDGGSYTLEGCTSVITAPPPTTSGNSTGIGGGGGGTGTGTGTGTGGAGGTGAGAGGTGAGGGTTGGGGGGGADGAGAGGGDERLQKRQSRGCTVTSSSGAGRVINPVMSARLSTKGKRSIRFGKVEVRAKLPRGDWLWPKIFMLPVEERYGPGLVSGQIDIASGRGNLPPYPSSIGNNHAITSRFLYAPMPAYPYVGVFPSSSATPMSAVYSLIGELYGWFGMKQKGFDEGWHVFGMEWTGEWARIYVDNRLGAVVNLRFDKKAGDDGWFWQAAKFPETAQNGTSRVAVENPWKDGSLSAPFDQEFYLVLSLAVGGTSGWFPDDQGGKPWFDASGTAMRDFTRAQNTWYQTWPSSADDRAMRVDSVKMWKLCG